MTILQISRKIIKLQAEIDTLKKQVGILGENKLVSKEVKKIIDVVESYYKLPQGSVYKRTRNRQIVDARWVAIVIIKGVLGLNRNKRAAIFGLRGITILHADRSIRDLFHTNSVIHNDIVKVCHKLKLDNDFITKLLSYDDSGKNSA
jgi:chromosomal replication initiation ATPase DnaA